MDYETMIKILNDDKSVVNLFNVEHLRGFTSNHRWVEEKFDDTDTKDLSPRYKLVDPDKKGHSFITIMKPKDTSKGLYLLIDCGIALYFKSRDDVMKYIRSTGH